MTRRKLPDNLAAEIRRRIRELRVHLTQNPGDWAAHYELMHLIEVSDELV